MCTVAAYAAPICMLQRFCTQPELGSWRMEAVQSHCYTMRREWTTIGLTPLVQEDDS